MKVDAPAVVTEASEGGAMPSAAREGSEVGHATVEDRDAGTELRVDAMDVEETEKV